MPLPDRQRRRDQTGRPRHGAAGQYRELLNTMIESARDRSYDDYSNLPPSQIGASFWTSQEKDDFFAGLSRGDPNDLRSLAAAVGSKSEAEVYTYQQLLQEGVTELEATPRYRNGSSFAEVPAACEVSAECEQRLQEAANELTKKLGHRDERTERQRHGDCWLIDEALAAQIEANVDNDEAQEPENKDESAAGHSSDHGHADLITPQGLLCPGAFISTSRALFMNMPAVSGTTWHDFEQEAHSRPAIFRTAFDDFYNLAVSTTRRLVHATLFQARTRLRATDTSRSNWSPTTEVTSTDVRAALDVLGMDHDGRRYWARLPRRSGLEVFTDAKEYKTSGRQSTKIGVKLTYEEVETALGEAVAKDQKEAIIAPLDPDDLESDEFSVISDHDSETALDNPESEIGDPGPPAQHNDDVADPEYQESAHEVTERVKQEDSEDEEGRVLKKSRIRPALSPASFTRAETSYLEAVDQRTSKDEERRLWELLRTTPPEALTETRTELPQAPVMAISDFTMPGDWRAKREYQAEWEYFGYRIPEQEFAEMGQEGVRGRKRRKLLAERMPVREDAEHGGTLGRQGAKSERRDGPSREASEVDGADDVQTLHGTDLVARSDMD